MFRYTSIAKGFRRKTIISFVLVGFAALAFASMGGGGAKKSKTVKADFVPIRTTNGFTLKAGPSYHGSLIFGQEKNKNVISFNSVVTYQKGNTTYILPYKYRMQTSSMESRNNMQLFNLKLKMHK
jgi:hypothetical protein